MWMLWGKFGGPGELPEDGEPYHPAIFHMLDVGTVAEVLLPRLGASLAGHLGVPVEVASPWTAFLVAAHDIGKLHPGFQQKIDDPARMAVLDKTGLPLIDRSILHFEGEGSQGFDHGLQSV